MHTLGRNVSLTLIHDLVSCRLLFSWGDKIVRRVKSLIIILLSSFRASKRSSYYGGLTMLLCNSCRDNFNDRFGTSCVFSSVNRNSKAIVYNWILCNLRILYYPIVKWFFILSLIFYGRFALVCCTILECLFLLIRSFILRPWIFGQQFFVSNLTLKKIDRIFMCTGICFNTWISGDKGLLFVKPSGVDDIEASIIALYCRCLHIFLQICINFWFSQRFMLTQLIVHQLLIEFNCDHILFELVLLKHCF